MDYRLYIYNNGAVYNATHLCEGEITVTTERKGQPGKLTFKIARDICQGQKISFAEGNRVELIVNNYNMFKGYIFTKSRTKEQIITVTAYDQLRYLKNKQFYNYTNKKAGDIVKMIASDFKLAVGEIEDTGYIIGARREEKETLFDIILNAIDLTNVNTKRLYTLYDDFGKLCLKNINNMRLPLMFISDDVSLIDFSYKTDIDSDTYNRIKLYKDDNEKGTREVYIAEDSLNQAKWGILQYYESVPDHYNSAQIQEVANRLLTLKNRIKKTLSIEFLANNLGEEKIRGGSGIMVKIDDLGESSACNWFMVNKATHTFKNNEHTVKVDIEEGYW